MIKASNKKIICTHFSRGKKHDYKLFKHSNTHFHQNVILCVDSAYQGIEKLYPHVWLPNKTSKYKRLSEKEEKHNRLLAKCRVLVEHVIRTIKVFRIVRERYRNRRNRFNLRMNLIAGLYNYELC